MKIALEDRAKELCELITNDKLRRPTFEYYVLAIQQQQAEALERIANMLEYNQKTIDVTIQD